VWILSVAVLFVVATMATHQPIPTPLLDVLNRYLEDDGSSTKQIIALGFLAGALASMTPVRLILRYFSTVVHELGHAFMAGALFARPKSILIHPSSSGLAIYQLAPNWGRFRATLVSAAGYPAPSIAALGAVQAIQSGHTIAWTLFSVGVLSITIVLLIRNLWGVLWTSGVVAGSYFGLQHFPIQWIGAGVVGIAGFLAVNSIQFAWTQLTLARKMRGSGIDAESIEMYTRIPSAVVAFGHLMTCLVISGYAAKFAVEPYWTEIGDWLNKLY